MAEEPNIPEHIARHKKLYEKGKILLETIKRSHRTSYDVAAGKHLTNDEGNIDMSKLEDVKVQEAFIKTLLDSYKTDAKKALGSKKEDAHLDDLVMNAYHGVSSDTIANAIRQFGKKYTFDTHYELMEDMLKKHVKPTLESTAKAHLNKEHIGDIIKYTKVNFDPSKMKLTEAIRILEEYHENEMVNPKIHKKELYYKKP